jgi:type II secretion system protein D
MWKSLLKRRKWRSTRRIGYVVMFASTLLFLRTGIAQLSPRFPDSEPKSGPRLALAQTESKIVPYALNESSRKVLAAWQKQAASRTDVRVAIDERTGQALVVASPAVHAQIRQQIAQEQNRGTAPTQPPSNAGTPPPGAGQSMPDGTLMVQLRHLPPAELRTRLERLLSRELPATMDATGEWQGFAVEASPGVGVTMNVNSRTGQVRIAGAASQVAAWRSVVEALDTPPTAGTVTQLVATKPASQERVRQALQWLQPQPGQSETATGARTVAMLQQQGGQAGGAGQPGAAAGQPQAAQQDTTQLTPGGAQTAEQAAQLAEAAGGLLGPVQIEYVEGLDIIVIRGAERDVQRVMQIIEEIERLSLETVPTILIQPLQNVDSVQLAALLNRLYTNVLAARIGTVSITPLGMPNALLLIGRDANVQMAVNLIRQLDQPAMPTAQFQVFPLQNASAAEAKTLIDAFLRQDEDGEPQQDEPDANEPITEADALAPLAPRAIVVADIRTNFLIVRAAPRDMAQIAALVARIDQPGATATLKVFTIRNGDANTLVETLRTLFSIPAEGEEAAPGGISQGGVVRLQFAVDPRTNSIIAAGSADDLIVVEAILTRLDQGDVRERENRIYRLNNAAALDIANALQQWLIGRQQAQAEAAVTISPFEQIEQEVIIVPEVATNSLIVSATPRYYEEVERMIRQLDERPPMVMIQVLIGEVTLNDTDQFGVELGLQDSLLFDRSLLGALTTTVNTTTTQSAGGATVTTEQEVIQNAPGVPGFNFNDVANPLGNNLSTNALATAGNVAAQGISNFSVGRWDPLLGFGGFVFSASSDAVSVLLRALQENRRLEVLSRPQLMALDGQQGSVQVGQNVPRIAATSIDPIAGTTNTIVYEQVGLILNVIPRISPDGLIVLQIQAIKSEVGPEAEGIPISISPGGQILRAPRINITQAFTTVSALSGQTVVLGGLLETRKSDVHRRVPIIADIPLIGDLFRYDAVAEQRRELLIILTPRIVYGKEDSDLVKQIESSRMSWILGDVINMHGEAGLRSRCDEWSDADIEAVFPNYVPEEGLLPLSENAALLNGEQVLGAPYCDSATMPPLTAPLPAYEQQPSDEQPAQPAAPLPVYEQQPSDEQPAQPAAPLPPQPIQSPPLTPPQASTGSVPDNYGFIDMTAGEEPAAAPNSARRPSPKSYE